MPDYIQLLETKLSANQKQALNALTDVARSHSITVFLTGGAVRDIASGASVRDLDITVQGNPFKFKKELEKAGFSVSGEHAASHTLYLRFGKQSRVELSGARHETFPKPARPEYHPAGILDDLRRRDFTANAMALSLNEGSWGLLLDPLNGMADISARQLRLVSNYGFLEDPIRMVRATRLLSRTGWQMEEPTRQRYQNAKDEGVISAITAAQRGYELEEIAYEEDPIQAIKALEAEGWMEHLFPAWTSHSVDVQGMERLHERLVKLLMAGLEPDPSSAQFRLLTAKLSPSNFAGLKRLFVRNFLIREADALDDDAKKFLQQISTKDASKPSELWKLFHRSKQEAILWLYCTGKASTVLNRFEMFFTKWPEARQKIPNAILQDMRILPDVEGYAELVDKLTFAFMDDELPNEEAIRKLAEPYSPPAPPPPVIVRRTRSVKRVVDAKGTKGKSRKGAKKAEVAGEESGIALAAQSGAPETQTDNTAAAEHAAPAEQAVKTSHARPAAKRREAAKAAPAIATAPPYGKAQPLPAKSGHAAEKTARDSQKASTTAAAKDEKHAPSRAASSAVKVTKPVPGKSVSGKSARHPAKAAARPVVAKTAGAKKTSFAAGGSAKTVAKPAGKAAAKAIAPKVKTKTDKSRVHSGSHKSETSSHASKNPVRQTQKPKAKAKPAAATARKAPHSATKKTASGGAQRKIATQKGAKKKH